MRRVLPALLTGAMMVSPAIAKTSHAGLNTSVSYWAGTWDCVSGKNTFTETFTPILNNKGMRVSVTGPYASEGVAVYDISRKAWFYSAINADGTYGAMMGPVSGSNVRFKQVFPPGIVSEEIHATSNVKYSSVFSIVANNKKVSAKEICTKR